MFRRSLRHTQGELITSQNHLLIVGVLQQSSYTARNTYAIVHAQHLCRCTSAFSWKNKDIVASWKPCSIVTSELESSMET
jgi:hypothetical protein